MENPRPEKVAVVDEVRERIEGSSAVLLTEYRGLDVGSIGELRRALRAAGGDYKVYKNSLVRFAVRDLGLEIEDLLTGPTAIAFVAEKPDGTPGDAVDLAKALKDFAKGNPALVVKGGVLGDKLLDAGEANALADVEPREVLLAKLAGGMAAPMQQLAGLLAVLPRNMAYALKALIDQGGAPGAPVDETPAEETPAEAPAEDAPAEEAAAEDAPADDAPADEAPADEAPAEAATAADDAPETTDTDAPDTDAAESTSEATTTEE
jgi:large subunit ribosomal protein L10